MFALAAIALFVAMILVLVRLFSGPTLYDRVMALNSFGTHTVKSVEGIWPPSVAFVDISYKPFYDVVLDKPGIYGFRCKIHSRHGMFALVAVGDIKPAMVNWKNADLSDIGRKVFSVLFEQLEKEIRK